MKRSKNIETAHAANPTKRAEEASTALATRQAISNLAIADDAKAGDTRGTEGIDADDTRLSFIAIAQKTSKAIDPSEGARYIDGLKFGEMYNTESKVVYGVGPLEFVPLMLRKRACLLNENGTLGEEVPWDDPRVTWEGAREQGLDKPEGQRIYDWAVLVIQDGAIVPQPVVLSFRSTSFGAGKSLNGFVKARKPSFAGKYTATVFIDKNENGNFGRFLISPAGKPTADQFEFAEAIYESIRATGIQTKSEDEAIDATAVVEGNVAPAATVTAEKVPF